MRSVNTDVSCIFYYSRFVGFSQDFLQKKKKKYTAHEYPGLVRLLQMHYMDGLSTQNGCDWGRLKSQANA